MWAALLWLASRLGPDPCDTCPTNFTVCNDIADHELHPFVGSRSKALSDPDPGPDIVKAVIQQYFHLRFGRISIHRTLGNLYNVNEKNNYFARIHTEFAEIGT